VDPKQPESEQPAEEATPARKGMMRFRKSNAQRLPPEDARRQGEITQLAFLLLGREAAIEFLNTEHDGLGGRPLDLAIASEEGRNSVEAEIGRMAYVSPEATGR
jgi:uncharacterized protein (DUF2384 family)